MTRAMPELPFTLEQLNARIAPLFPGLMGVEITAVSQERVIARMTVRPDLCTAGGILHGGACMAFADALGAIGTILNLSPDKRTTTTSSSTQFIAGAPVHTVVTGESLALHRGRTTMVWQTTIRSEAGRLCAVVIQNQLVLDA